MDRARKAKNAQKAENAGGGGDAARRDQSKDQVCNECGRKHSLYLDHWTWELYFRVLPTLLAGSILVMLLETWGLL